MAEYIDRERVANMMESAQIISDGEYNGYCTEDIDLNAIPSEDVVPRSVYDQVVWGRDIIDEAREMVKTLHWIASNEDIVFNARSATEAADLIERLVAPGESAPTGWISVKDRLPEDGAPVLVCYIGAKGSVKGDAPCTDGTANYYRGAWYWWEEYGASNDEPVKVKITHWMPLPEPPGDSDAQD